MRSDLSAVVARGERIVLDGGMGALLQGRGLPAGAMPETWVWQNPAAVQQAHAEFVAAGARLVTTNTVGANAISLVAAGLEGRVRETNRRAAELAREAVGEDVWVAGSVGPTGRLLEPYGELTLAQAENAFREQILGLGDGGVDVILVETQHDLDEACCALRLARDLTTLPVWVTFAFNRRGRTLMGVRPALAAERCAALGAMAVGANCGDGPEAVLAALKGFAGHTSLSLIAQPNAGMPRAEAGVAVWDLTPDEMSDYAGRYLALGAQLVGGCCGVMPEHIRAIAALV